MRKLLPEAREHREAVGHEGPPQPGEVMVWIVASSIQNTDILPA